MAGRTLAAAIFRAIGNGDAIGHGYDIGLVDFSHGPQSAVSQVVAGATIVMDLCAWSMVNVHSVSRRSVAIGIDMAGGRTPFRAAFYNRRMIRLKMILKQVWRVAIITDNWRALLARGYYCINNARDTGQSGRVNNAYRVITRNTLTDGVAGDAGVMNHVVIRVNRCAIV